MMTATPSTFYTHGIQLPESLARYLDRYPVPDEAQELDLIRKAKMGHQASLTWLTIANVRLVCKLVSKYSFYVLDSQDLIQEGVIGIRHAIQKFDFKKNIRFSTYAYWWVLRYVRRFCNRNRTNQLRLPDAHQIKLDQIRKTQSDLPDAGIEEIAEKLKLDLEYAENLLFWGRPFQRMHPKQEFVWCEQTPIDEEEIIEFDFGELEPQIEVLQLTPPQPSVAESISAHLQPPARFLAQWFRVGVSQFVNAVKGEERPRIGGFQHRFFPHPSGNPTGQDRLNLNTWPVSLSFSYGNSFCNVPPTQPTTEPSPAKIICFVKGVLVHVQKSLLVFRGRDSDGPAARPGHQPAPAPERCRGLGAPRRPGGGYLGFCRQITTFIQSPLAAVIQSIRGVATRAGPALKSHKRKGAVFDLQPRNKGTPITHRINTMYKTLPAMIAVWLGLLISPALAETVNLSTMAVHTLDLTNPLDSSDQGCRVEKAYFGDPSAGQHLDIGLDQPQPRTQKITLRWKNKKGVDEVYLQMHLQGCSQNYAQISIKRVHDHPSSPVTYLNPVAQRPKQAAVTSQPPGKAVPPSPPTAVVPLTLQPIAKRPAPKTVKRPPVRKITLSQQTKPDPIKKGTPPKQQPIPTAKQSPSATQVTPATILRGLNVARSKGEIGYESDMHWKVNGMIRAMRRGSAPEAASKQAEVPSSVVKALIGYAQQ